MPPQIDNGGWVDDDPNWQDDPIVTPTTEPSLWERANAPLITAPSTFARDVGTRMTEHSLDESMLGSQLRGFGAGALEGLGDLVSGLSSPVNLATTLLTMGQGTAAKMGLTNIARMAGYGAKGAGALTAAHGAQTVGQGISEGDIGKAGTGIVEMAGGGLGMRGVTPKAKPKLKSDQLIDDLTKTAHIQRPDASKFTPEEFSQMNEFMGKGADEAELAAIREGAGKPAATPISKAIETAKTNEGGWVDDTPAPKAETGPRKLGEGIYDEFAIYREAPVGRTYRVSPKDMPRKKLAEAIKLGFDYIGLDEKGRVVIKKVKESPAPDLVEVSPGQLGVKTDIKSPSKITEALNFGRGTMTSIDFSAPLRQGIGLIHKKEFWKALPDMFRAWRTEEGFRNIQNEIANRPAFRKTIGADGKVQPSFADRAGLSLSDLTDLSKREEALMSTWAEKVPGVRRSNRAYTAFLNKLRADTFESLITSTESFGVKPKNNLPLATALADFVNVATGRGGLGKLEGAAVPLNTLLFSPRLMASRLRMLDPRMYLMGPKAVRKEAIKSLFAIATAGNVITQLGKLAGGEVSNDPNSSDFGKLKVGNTRIDPYAGFQQYIVAANRLLRPGWAALPGGEGGTDTGLVPLDTLTGFAGTGGQTLTSSTEGNQYDLWEPQRPFDPNHLSVVGRFLRGKAHPMLGFAISLFNGRKEMSGEEMNFSAYNPFGPKGENIMDNAIAQRFIPLVAQDLYELYQENPDMLPIAGPLTTFGMGSQTYGEGD